MLPDYYQEDKAGNYSSFINILQLQHEAYSCPNKAVESARIIFPWGFPHMIQSEVDCWSSTKICIEEVNNVLW